MVTRRSIKRIGFGSKTKYRLHDILYIAISNHVKDMLISGGIAKDKVVVIPSMLALSEYEFKIGKDIRGIKPKRIIAAGALEKNKGFMDALKAVKLLAQTRDDFFFTLYGEGPEKVRLKKFIKTQGLGALISLAGWHDLPSQFMTQADLFLSPSYTEGLNMSIVEAMAAGVPVIASDLPAHRENIIEGITGLLFPPGDVEGMVHKITTLLDSPSLYESIRVKARERALDYDSHKISDKVFQLYNRLID